MATFKRMAMASVLAGILLASCFILGGFFKGRASEQGTGVFYRDQVLFLMYHHIDRQEKGITISPKRFESHMRELDKSPYNVISMETYLKFVNGEAAIPPNAVVITFDDGYESFYEYAFPILQKYGFPATHFIIGELVGKTVHNTAYMTWEQMKEMKQAGMSFYSHTHNLHRQVNVASGQTKPALTHRSWIDAENREETDAEYRERVKRDLLHNEQLLRQNLGEQQALLCFPFGAYNETVLAIGKELGMSRFFTTDVGITGRDDQLVLRLNAGQAWVESKQLLKMMRQQAAS